MIASRIVSKIEGLERILKMSAWNPIEPKRRAQIVATLNQLRRDCTSMGYTPDEIEKNDVFAGVDKVGIQKQILVVPPPDPIKQ